MHRQVRFYPFGDPNLYSVAKNWLNIEINNESATELWIDSNWGGATDLSHECFKNIKKVYFFDCFHAYTFLHDQIKKNIQRVSEHYPTVWYTGNALPVDGINCVRFDYLWNRTKLAYLDHTPSWNHIGDPRAYRQYPLHFGRRQHRYLSLNRSLTPYRKKLLEFLNAYDGLKSNTSQGLVLPNDFVTDLNIQQGTGGVLPAARFFDNSYISCQVESQYQGTDSVIFTEKTYEHLIQGRLVLNFGPPGFYSALEADGWKLPLGIDLSWDLTLNTDDRFKSYLDTLRSLFEMSLDQLHELFLFNSSVIEHNYNMLITKPYNCID
jgi:hypothetical protein